MQAHRQPLYYAALLATHLGAAAAAEINPLPVRETTLTCPPNTEVSTVTFSSRGTNMSRYIVKCATADDADTPGVPSFPKPGPDGRIPAPQLRDLLDENGRIPLNRLGKASARLRSAAHPRPSRQRPMQGVLACPDGQIVESRPSSTQVRLACSP